MNELITANTWFANLGRPGPRIMTFADWRKFRLGRLRERFRIPDAGLDDTLEPVLAFVNKGRWIVVCPKCGGGEYAWEEGYYFCCSCLNSYMGHKFRRLVFPKERVKIEELLIVRPLGNRNWFPQETLAGLKRENEEHAVELLVKGGTE